MGGRESLLLASLILSGLILVGSALFAISTAGGLALSGTINLQPASKKTGGSGGTSGGQSGVGQSGGSGSGSGGSAQSGSGTSGGTVAQSDSGSSQGGSGGLFGVVGPVGNINPSGVGTGGGDLADSSVLSDCQIDKFLKGNAAGGMKDSGAGLSAAAKQFGVSPAFMLGIANAENSLGRAGLAIPNMNPGNVKLSASTAQSQGISVSGNDSFGHTMFNSWADGWAGMAYTLRAFYLDEGRTTLPSIAEKYLTGNKERWVENILTIIRAAQKEKC
jgi:hypothetical protein